MNNNKNLLERRLHFQRPSIQSERGNGPILALQEGDHVREQQRRHTVQKPWNVKKRRRKWAEVVGKDQPGEEKPHKGQVPTVLLHLQACPGPKEEVHARWAQRGELESERGTYREAVLSGGCRTFLSLYWGSGCLMRYGSRGWKVTFLKC